MKKSHPEELAERWKGWEKRKKRKGTSKERGKIVVKFPRVVL